MNEQPVPPTPLAGPPEPMTMPEALPPAPLPPGGPQAAMTLPEVLPPSPKKQNPLKIFGIIALVMGILFAGAVIAIFTFASHVDNEQDFAVFVKESIVGDKELTNGWVNNQTQADASFQEDFKLMKQAVKEGGFSDVTKYRECATITNPHEYSTISAAYFCAAKLCNPSTSNCIYLIGYSGGSPSSGSLKSFAPFETQSAVDAKIDLLLAKS